VNNLSPAAQAVLDAANGCSTYGPDDCLNESRWIAAGALRAAVAATQMRQYVDGSIEALGWICEADELLTIADELDGANSTS
jgi:hypothetical protein